MNILQKNIYLIFLFFSGIFFGYYIGQSPIIIDNTRSQFPFSSISPWSLSENGEEKVFESHKIEEAKKIISNKFYHFSEKTKIEMENSFISSLVWSLWDKHSSYFPPKEAWEFKDTLQWDFEWIGAVIDEHPKWIKIQKILKNSPAEKGGLKNGDILLSIDTTRLVWLSTEQAVDKIRWPKGTKITIKYLRGEENTEITTDIVRDRVLVPSTQEKILTGSIGYLEVWFFGEHTIDEFEKSFHILTASGSRWIILDFRNNPGWYLDSAVEILSLILPKNSKAVITRENDPKKTEILYTKWFLIPSTTIPIIMLVNWLSASASEIVAGALQDHKRAILIGEKTYGKWSVQTPFSMSDGSMLKLTIGKWYTPNDRGIDGEGIIPDIIISMKDEDYKNLYDRQLEWALKIMDTLIQNSWSVEKTIETIKKPQK